VTAESAHPLRLPEWLLPLVAAVEGVGAADIAPFLPLADSSARDSAVLIALSDSPQGPGVLLIERASTMRTHAGQTAFPGGAAEPGDADEASTALREANEEVGIDPSSVEIVASLPALFLPPSGFLVTPVIAWWAAPHPVHAVDPREVARAVVVPIAELADPANRFGVRHTSGYTGPGFEAGGLFVWGFTAGLLDFLLHLGGWELAWDRERVRPLPSRASTPEVGTVTP
jgi:8-oxo-dGTP pyrophosphatase MutT (NUDIX family)